MERDQNHHGIDGDDHDGVDVPRHPPSDYVGTSASKDRPLIGFPSRANRMSFDLPEIGQAVSLVVFGLEVPSRLLRAAHAKSVKELLCALHHGDRVFAPTRSERGVEEQINSG